jgi:hypothetical protein
MNNLVSDAAALLPSCKRLTSSLRCEKHQGARAWCVTLANASQLNGGWPSVVGPLMAVASMCFAIAHELTCGVGGAAVRVACVCALWVAVCHLQPPTARTDLTLTLFSLHGT